MNVYPSAIRDVLLSRFSGAVTPYMRTLKQREDQVRFDSPIPFEIERGPELGASQLPVVRVAIETEVRSRLQIRVDVTIVEPGTIPRTAYKTALVQLGDSSAVVGREVAWHTFLRRRSIASSRADSARSATGSAADQSLLEYQIIFENAIVGICSMRNRILLRCNRRMEQIFGFGPGELDQQPVRILYPNKEAYERIDKVYANFPRHNQYVHEPQLVRKDGRLIWCIVSGRLLDPREPAAGSIWVVQDITERRITENALRQANKRLEMRVEQRTTNLRRTNQALKVEVQRRKDMRAASFALGGPP